MHSITRVPGAGVSPPDALSDVDEEAAALIREARQRQRRRWLVAAVAVVVSVAAVVATAVFAGSGSGSRARPSPSSQTEPIAPALAPALVTVSATHLPKGGAYHLASGFHAVWVTGIGVTYQISQTSGRILRTIATPGTFPDGCGGGVAAGAGAVWVTHGCRGVYRIDPRSGRITASLRVPNAGGSIAVAGGLVWVTNYFGNLLRIQPRTDHIVGKPIAVGEGDWALALGAGALWVSSYGGGGPGPYPWTVARIDLATGRVRHLRHLADVVAVGAGSLWTSYVRRVDPATGKVLASINVPGVYPAVVAFWRGSAWALEEIPYSIRIVRIDPATNRVTGSPVLVGKPLTARFFTDPTAMTAGPTGLWVLDYNRQLLFHLAPPSAAP